MTTVFPTIDQAEFQTDISNEIHSSIESSFLTLDDEIGSMNSHLSKLDIQLKEEENTTSLMSISGSSSSSLSSYHKPDSADYSPVSSTEIDITLDKPHSPTLISEGRENHTNIPNQSRLEQKEKDNMSPGGYNNETKYSPNSHSQRSSAQLQSNPQISQGIPVNQMPLINNYHPGPYMLNNAGPYYNTLLKGAQNMVPIVHGRPGSISTPPLPPFTQAEGMYLADSSVAAANAAGRKPSRNSFPPPTKENLIKYRNEANATNDPRLQLNYAKFLLTATARAFSRTQDPKRVKKARENMIMEAQKIVKKLASHSGMGKHGYAEAQFFLANCYGTGGLGLQKDTEKAFSLYLQGSKQNHAGCTYRAAVCYEVGAGTKRDKNHAMQFYRKAANLGEPTAMYKVGIILLKGFLGQPKNPREGISWLKRASQSADQDHPHALHELAMAYEKEGVPSVIPDPNYSRELYSQAAQYGYVPSQLKLGLAYENGFLNCPIDPRRSIAWYSKAAQQGDLESQFALSGWYLTGADGILQQNDTEAYLWARKAADRGYSKAEYAVGYYTETGTGVPRNIEEAKRWYRLAAAQNYRRAKQRLAELKHVNARPRQRRRLTREDKKKDSECNIM